MPTKTITAAEFIALDPDILLDIPGWAVIINISDPEVDGEYKTAQLIGTVEHIVFAEGGLAIKLQGEGSTPVPVSELSKVSFTFNEMALV